MTGFKSLHVDFITNTKSVYDCSPGSGNGKGRYTNKLQTAALSSLVQRAEESP